MFITTPRQAFITLKDHKSDFSTNPKVRLLNPRKPELGRVAKKILDTIINEVKQKNSNLNQLTSNGEVLDWFMSIKNKNIYKFIQFDIESFYPSITQELLEKSLEWASNYTSVAFFGEKYPWF